MNSILSGLILLVLITITVIFAYYVTAIIGKKTKSLMDYRYTQVLERTIIGLNTNITIVKVNKKIYIIALQGKNFNVLDVIDEKDWDYLPNKNESSFYKKYDLSNILKSKLFKS